MNTFETIGYIVAACTTWGLILVVVSMLCFLSNRVTHMVLDSYGGWKTFIKYRDWYFEQEETK